MIFDECREQAAELGNEVHGPRSSCQWCTFDPEEFEGHKIGAAARKRMSDNGLSADEQRRLLADLGVDQGTEYTMVEARQLLYLGGMSSRGQQDRAIQANGVDGVVSLCLEMLAPLPADVRMAIASKAYPGRNPNADPRGKADKFTRQEKDDPRCPLWISPKQLEHLRVFYREHGRLPAVIVIRYIDGSVVAPDAYRAALAHRFDLEMEPEFF